MATAGGLRRLVYIPYSPLTPNGERQPQGQQDSGGGLWLLFPFVAAFVIIVACIFSFYPICKKAEDLESGDHRPRRGSPQSAVAEAASTEAGVRAAVPEVVVDIDKLRQQAEPSLKCTYRAADGWEERTCSVCLAELQDGEAVMMVMPCTHYFHAACFDRWMRKNATCPICRAPTVAAKAGRQ